METTGFRVIITLATPAFVSSLTTLDSVLFRALHDQTEHSDDSELPLSLRDGCFCASSLQFGRGYWHEVTQIGRLTTRDWEPSRYTTRDGLGNPKFLVAGGLYAPRLDRRRAWIGTVSFQGMGIPDKVEELLTNIQGLGAKTSHGFGEIARLRLDTSDTEGLASDGYPLRPIPLRLWEQWGHALHEGIALDAVAWRPPYWSPVRELCVVPNW